MPRKTNHDRLTSAEAARRIGVEAGDVSRLVKLGLLATDEAYPGSYRRFRLETVEAYVKSRQTQAGG